MWHEQQNKGIIYTLGAYFIWGFLPIYWKLVGNVPAGEVLAHRIVWSFVLMLAIILVSRKWTSFVQECKEIIKDKYKVFGITFASIAISLNWFVFIWAVNSGYIVEASLGYYINPLISIILGVIVLKETITRRQLFAFILAGIGVITLTLSFGVFPWISIFLAVSFAVYGLLKKMVDISATVGLTIETLIVSPIALIYLLVLPVGSFTSSTVSTATPFLLIGTGVATAVPLLLFAHGAKRIPLALLGFLQYIAPTIMLIIGVFVYGETFSLAHLISFTLIWIALIIYLGSIQRKPSRKHTRSS